MKIAVMGYGTIGSGVVDVLRINKEKITKRAGEPVDVKYILDRSAYDTYYKSDTFVRLHPDKQLNYCNIASMQMQ